MFTGICVAAFVNSLLFYPACRRTTRDLKHLTFLSHGQHPEDFINSCFSIQGTIFFQSIISSTQRWWMPGDITASLTSESLTKLTHRCWRSGCGRHLLNVETLLVTSVWNKNGILEVRVRPWDEKLFVVNVLLEKFYWKKNPALNKNVYGSSSLQSYSDQNQTIRDLEI